MGTKRAGTAKGFADDRYRALIERLVDRRKELGMSQAALGARLGNHQQFVGRVELGERRLDVVEFADVARALDLDLDDLIKSIPE